ncbi:MAG: FkbM family methyltransferase [Pedobacter sp.]|nr:MAG: FkbM family methyltransferase [Pedobacter sp.]
MNRTLKFIFNHPFTRNNRISGIVDLVIWQIRSRLTTKPIKYQFTEKSKLMVTKGLAGATGNIYCGLHEFEDMGFLLHVLRKDDLFLDVGANIGSYSILASAEIGAKTIAFEPIAHTYHILKQNIAVNKIEERVEALNIGVGSNKGVLKFIDTMDTCNHVSSDSVEGTEVNVDTLDNVLNGRSPLLLKIDVEGFETEVLEGAAKCLKDPVLKAIIIELNGDGSRYGYEDSDIHKLLIEHGFSTFTYDPFKRILKEEPGTGHLNTLYVRDIDFVQERVSNSRKVRVKNKAF